MINLILEPNLSEPSLPRNILLDCVVTTTETPAMTFEIWWRWEDEDDMKPEFLGRGVAGENIRIPFETKGRDLHLYLVSITVDGVRSVRNLAEAVQIVFSSPARAFSGEVIVEAGENLAAFDLVHIYDDAGTEKARKADATDATKPARAFVVEAAAGDSLITGDHVRLFFGGNLITRIGKGWTPGAVLYLSEASGDITTTAPSGAGKIVQVIGTAISAETAIFEPDEPIELE